MKKEWIDNLRTNHSGEVFGIKDEYSVIDCEKCGFKHVIPIPSEEFLNDYYTKYFVKNRPGKFYKKMEQDVPWLQIMYSEKYDLFEKHLPKSRRSILDVGCGLGYFLKTGIDRGWQTFGVEASIESATYARKFGIEILNEYLNDSNYLKLGQYDVIHMHEVLEHLPNPIEMINVVKKMLNPGGFICIVSPNDFNPLQEAFIANYKYTKWWISPPEHINYFNFTSIRNLLTKQDFKIIEQTATFPLEIFLLMGDNYIGNSEIGKTIHKKRVNFESNLYNNGYENIRRDLYHKFSEMEIGREFCIIGKLKI